MATRTLSCCCGAPLRRRICEQCNLENPATYQSAIATKTRKEKKQAKEFAKFLAQAP